MNYYRTVSYSILVIKYNTVKLVKLTTMPTIQFVIVLIYFSYLPFRYPSTCAVVLPKKINVRNRVLSAKCIYEITCVHTTEMTANSERVSNARNNPQTVQARIALRLSYA